MFHKAIDLKFLSGTTLDVWFQDGLVKRYNMASLFPKYPQLKALKDRPLFLSGTLMGPYGIVWNDDLDVETETIYEDGETVEIKPLHGNFQAANAILAARAKAGLTQKQLADLAGIDQSEWIRKRFGQEGKGIRLHDGQRSGIFSLGGLCRQNGGDCFR